MSGEEGRQGGRDDSVARCALEVLAISLLVAIALATARVAERRRAPAGAEPLQATAAQGPSRATAGAAAPVMIA